MKWIQRAERALASAQLPLNAGDYDGASNRAYYAMFEVASAALEQIGITPKTHSTVLGEFSRAFVHTGRIPREFGRSLNDAQETRRFADYSHDGVTPEQATDAVAAAERFLSVCIPLFTSPGNPT